MPMVIVAMMGMIMRSVVVCPVVMVMRMVMIVVMRIVAARRLGIGAAFRIERRLDLDHARTEPFDHRLDDMIAADAQALAHDLRRQVAVAQMPGEPHQMMRIVGADLQQRLRCCNDLDQATIFEHERIATAQGDGVLEVEQKCEPARAGHRHPPPMAVVEIEHDGIGGGLSPSMLSKHTRGADHAGTPILFNSVQRTSTFAGVMISIRGGAAKHFTATRPNAFM